jgi:chromate reductase, NAD(P)H dehydrogenase (quinone)
MSGDLKILGISGSLRAGSLNTRLLQAAVELAPPGMTIELYHGLGGLPHYNGDLDGAESPPAVTELRSDIARADGVLIVTPEYNYSIPGVLKNAIDWASRPSATSALRGKPVAAMGAAPGNFGTVRAQLALRQMWVWIDSVPVVKPEVHVFRAAERFDDTGRLTDATTRELIVELLEALRTTIERHRMAEPAPPAAG